MTKSAYALVNDVWADYLKLAFGEYLGTCNDDKRGEPILCCSKYHIFLGRLGKKEQ